MRPESKPAYTWALTAHGLAASRLRYKFPAVCGYQTHKSIDQMGKWTPMTTHIFFYLLNLYLLKQEVLYNRCPQGYEMITAPSRAVGSIAWITLVIPGRSTSVRLTTWGENIFRWMGSSLIPCRGTRQEQTWCIKQLSTLSKNMFELCLKKCFLAE